MEGGGGFVCVDRTMAGAAGLGSQSACQSQHLPGIVIARKPVGD